jgi:UDP-N-acetylmuramate--alanine ligase
MYKRVKEQVHFIGIGGIGMSGIAEVLARQGFPVSGSDQSESETVRRLRDLGVRVAMGHRAENLAGAKVVVVSSAIGRDNPEILEAQRLGLPLVPRAEMLAELMRLRFGIAVAGTHGKTTTTSMLASMLAHAGEDPTVVVGGKVDALGGNAKLGQGKFLIAEADESDGSFLRLSPVVTVVTNIDNDHLDYYGQMEKLRMSFVEFANKVPYYGRSVVCRDDAEIAKLLPLIAKPHWTFGFSAESDFRIVDFRPKGIGSVFSLLRNGTKLCDVTLAVPGEHNARNAVGALAAALEIDVDLTLALDGLAQFTGVRRRFEIKGQMRGREVTVVDDYGHHPTEIAATLSAARGFWKSGRIVVAFQPHRYTRTQICWDQFAKSFAAADKVYLLDVYAAGESPIAGITSEKLAKLISCDYVGTLDEAAKRIAAELNSGDLLITLGAGSITQLGAMLLK